MKYLAVLFLMLVAIGGRLWFHIAPNVEFVTLVTFLAAFYLGKKEALIVALSSMAISDIFIGNTSIALFTWSAYGMIALWAVIVKRLIRHFERSEKSSASVENENNVSLDFSPSLRTGFEMTKRRTFMVTDGGIMATLWFYLWTNFGVWFLDSWNMYPKTFQGLTSCYINALPFLRNQLLGNLLIVPIGFVLIELSKIIIFRRIKNKSIVSEITVRELLI